MPRKKKVTKQSEAAARTFGPSYAPSKPEPEPEPEPEVEAAAAPSPKEDPGLIEARLLSMEERIAKAQAQAAAAEDRAAAAEVRAAAASPDKEKEAWAARERQAKNAGVEVEAFWLTQRCYMRQYGDMAEKMVYGSPSRPIKVLLEKYIEVKRPVYMLDEDKKKIYDSKGRARRTGELTTEIILRPESPHLRRAEPALAVDAVRPTHGQPRKAPPSHTADKPLQPEGGRVSDQ